MRAMMGFMFAVSLVVGCAMQPVAAGPVTPFSLTKNGLTATFTSTPNPNGFEIVDLGIFQSLTGLALVQSDPTPNQLIIQFSQPVSGISLNFALDISSPGLLSWQMLSGVSTMASGNEPASVPPGFLFDEGFLNYNFTGDFTFDKLVLYSPDANAIATDNFVAILPTGLPVAFEWPASIPEPVTLSLFAAGLLGAAAARRRNPGTRGREA